MRGRRKNRFRAAVVLFVVFWGAIFFFLQFSVAPLIVELAKARVDNRASYIINEAIETQMQSNDIDYENIVNLEKDMNGNITALKTNINEVNRLKTQILSVIDDMLLDLDVNEIGIPLGSLILPEIFSGTGPRLPVKVMSVSASDAEFHNVFSEAGINQTAHQMMMDVTIIMTVLTPIGAQSVTVTSAVVVAETIIVGIVPESYVNLKPGVYGE